MYQTAKKKSKILKGVSVNEITWLRPRDFYGNKNGPSGITSLTDNLKYIPNLEILNFGCNYIGDSEIFLLTSALQQMPNLTMLTLRENYVSNEGMNMLLRVIPVLENLNVFDIGCNDLNDNLFDSEFSKTISSLKFFNSLIIDNTNISDTDFTNFLIELNKCDERWQLERGNNFHREILLSDKQFAYKYILQIKEEVKKDEKVQRGLDSVV